MGQNENYFPWDEIPDSNILPTGFYLINVEEVEDTESQNTGNRMFVGSFKVEEPAQFKGMFTKRDYYVVGTEEAPKSVVAETMGARSFKKLLNGCQVPQASDIEKLLHGLQGRKCIARIVQFTVDKGEYKGQEDNKFTDFFKVGEREVGLDAVAGGKPRPVAVVAAAPPIAGGLVVPPVGASVPGTGTPPPPAAESAGQTTACPSCQKIVPLMEYAAHVEAGCK